MAEKNKSGTSVLKKPTDIEFWKKLSTTKKIIAVLVLCWVVFFIVTETRERDTIGNFCRGIGGSYNPGGRYDGMTSADIYVGCSVDKAIWVRSQKQIEDWEAKTKLFMGVAIKEEHYCQIFPYVGPSDPTCYTLLHSVDLE